MSLINSNPQIASKIDELWNKFWSGGISNPLTAIEQITYLLFLKKLDANDLDNLFSGYNPFSISFWVKQSSESSANDHQNIFGKGNVVFNNYSYIK